MSNAYGGSVGCQTNAPSRVTLVPEAVGNLNTQLINLEKVVGELFTRLIPIRKQKISECQKDQLETGSGVSLVDEINSQAKRAYKLNQAVVSILGDLEI
jgi:hypothetical protein